MAENIFGITDTGKVRDNNEDTFIAQPVSNNHFLLASVIDGVGGYHGGEVAAALAREQLLESLDAVTGELLPAMVQSIRKASQRIYLRKQQEKELDSMACVATVVLADVENNQFYYAHVGDTRLYLLRDSSLVKISKDHSFVGFLEDSGRLSESAAMSHPKRNEINKALGFDTRILTDDDYIETGQSPFLPGDMLLLCSDGLSDLVDKNEITAILTQAAPLSKKATQLVDAANHNGGRDNITVVLVQNQKVPQQPEAVMPVAAVKKKEDLVNDVSSPAPQEPAHVVANTLPTHTEKKGNGLTITLGILCLVFLGAAVWLFLQRPSSQLVANQTAAVSAKKVRNAQELKLQDLIDKATGDTLVLSDTVFKQPVVISDTLHVQKDSLYIKAKGNIILKRDSAYTGPAIQLNAKCKNIVLDNLHFQDFEAAIALNNTSLFLKNVQFINCKQPVQNVYNFTSNKTITANLPAVSFKADSLVKTPNTSHGSR
ncbi:serine/threonine-protein phosphatase [Mucilaginibacter robiniae]|uniref:Serine/threonine-protein phosphatase n=1 Tax=Mucilaginibacter robiniae TaxID=2728022 RepID=A0A7L5DVV6_9SPHI|nr:protein phosphatase 2C domain-containing protein [Mucilaginibacter robiniae]QJD94871.1 serine/threonine-protein phosphatase [Mucilaginibacter robiniae]